MDLLLTHGYFLASDPREARIMKPYPPLGLLYLRASLVRAGFAVLVADSTFDTPEGIEARFEHERPPVVGIYGNLMTRSNVVRLARAAKRAGAHVVLGGPEPANYAEEFLERGADVIVHGEGEITLSELLPALRARGPHRLEAVAGITYRDEAGQVRRTPARALVKNLDDFPDPDREAIDSARYVRVWRERHGMGSISLITARGCPFTCRWCSHGVYGHTHRRHSVERTALQIEVLRERYQPDQLWFADDVFTAGKGWIYQLRDRLRARGTMLPFECITRADRMDEEVADALRDLRCRRVWIGGESGSQRILDAMERGVTVEQVRTAARLCRERGIEVGLFLMWGYDGEEIEDVEQTIAQVRATEPDEFLTTLSYPIKGTPYFEQLEGRRVTPDDWEHSSDREIEVRGRFSRRFYGLADRRLHCLVRSDRARAAGTLRGVTESLALEMRAAALRVAMEASSRRASL